MCFTHEKFGHRAGGDRTREVIHSPTFVTNEVHLPDQDGGGWKIVETMNIQHESVPGGPSKDKQSFGNDVF